MCPADWHGLAWLLRSHLILTLKCVHSRGKDSPVSTTEMSATGIKISPWDSSAMVAKIKMFWTNSVVCFCKVEDFLVRINFFRTM